MKSPIRDVPVVQRAAPRAFQEGCEVEPRDDQIHFFFFFSVSDLLSFFGRFFVRVCVSLFW
jgi:hypothetical protein